MTNNYITEPLLRSLYDGKPVFFIRKYLDLEQDFDALERCNDSLADGRRNAASQEIQHEIVVHDCSDLDRVEIRNSRGIETFIQVQPSNKA